jgi:hypothetical protein
MAERTHTSPNGDIRFTVLAQLSHVNLISFRRDYAGVTIFREVRIAVAFNAFDPSTWSGWKFVRRGDAEAIVTAIAFLDSQSNDIQVQLNAKATNESGHFGVFALFVWGGIGPQPVIFGVDARSVRRVRLDYVLPWDPAPRTLGQS